MKKTAHSLGSPTGVWKWVERLFLALLFVWMVSGALTLAFGVNTWFYGRPYGSWNEIRHAPLGKWVRTLSYGLFLLWIGISRRKCK